MPKIRCVCNYIIGLGDIPSPNQYMIISDLELDNYFENVDMEKLYLAMKIVVKCPSCGRLYFYCNGFDKDPIVYKLDN